MIKVVLFFGCMITTGCCFYALKNDRWVTFDVIGIPFHAGLWMICPENVTNTCVSGTWITDQTPSWIVTVRFLVILSIVLALLGAFSSLMSIYHIKMKTYVVSFIMMLTTITNTCACVIFSLHKGKHEDYSFANIQYEWGFYIACTSSGLAVIFCIMALIAECRFFKQPLDTVYGFFETPPGTNV